MNNLVVKENEMTNKIYNIRGVQVMLDSDLAKLYQCTNGTKEINQAVKRNIDKFPEDFYFQLTSDEYLNLKFQNGTSSLSNNYGGVRKLPYVFTEGGVAMLATVLKTEVASKVSVAIMKAFVIMHKYISNDFMEQKHINNMVIQHDEDIKVLKESFSKFEEKKKINEIYFNGQIYDAYSKIVDILKEANENIIIIDNYADKSILDMIRDIKVKVIIICKKKGLLKEIDINKYQSQYHNLEVKYNDTFHDRYIILDNKTIYHCGSSLNHLGNKTFSINKLEDEIVIKSLIDNVRKINN